jgi:antitoxin component YwqK of YwqJK toxin-antitoxin module
MKKLLSILLLSVVLIGCSEERVLMVDLTEKGTEESPLMYSESGLFNGVGYSVHSNGQTKEEVNYKDGKEDGLSKSWHSNGQLQYESNYKDGVLIE